MIKVVIGSKNPVKIKAVKNAFKKVFEDVKVQSVDVDSGVSHTPSTFDELVKGAINRAKNASKELVTDFAVGLEGGYEDTKFGAFLTGVVAIIDKEGKLGLSKSRGIFLPKKIIERLERGEELGPVMDDIQGVDNTKHKWGAVGFFTKKHLTRQESFEDAVVCALARFLRKELYEE